MKRLFLLPIILLASASLAHAQFFPPGGGGAGSVAWGGVTGTLSNQTDLQTALDAKLNAAPRVDLADVLSGSTYTLEPNTVYYGTVVGSKTFTISPALTVDDEGIIVRAHFDASSTQTVPTSVREGADASGTTVAVAADGNYTMSFLDDGLGNVRLYDTVPQKVTSADVDTSVIDDTAYDATNWNGDTDTAPSKNAIRDKIETLGAGSGLGYTIPGMLTSVSFSGSTTYYIGSLWLGTTATSTTYANASITIPKAGTIKSVFYRFKATAGSNESVPFSIRLNDTTDTALTATTMDTSTRAVNTTGLSVSVAAGDTIALKMATPAWGTPPTATSIYFTVYIE